MVAHTGIAATLLINGSTVHRQFAIPAIDEDYSKLKCDVRTAFYSLNHFVYCRQPRKVNWSNESGKQMRQYGTNVPCLIVEFVLTMTSHKTFYSQVFEVVEKLLTELNAPNAQPFGGKLILLGGDWKQLLPVVRGGHGKESVGVCLKWSALWSTFKTLTLVKNMRLEEGAAEFADYLVKIGEASKDVMNGIHFKI